MQQQGHRIRIMGRHPNRAFREGACAGSRRLHDLARAMPKFAEILTLIGRPATQVDPFGLQEALATTRVREPSPAEPRSPRPAAQDARTLLPERNLRHDSGCHPQTCRAAGSGSEIVSIGSAAAFPALAGLSVGATSQRLPLPRHWSIGKCVLDIVIPLVEGEVTHPIPSARETGS